MKIDIIICIYNNFLLLEKALSAISKQKVSPEINWKVLVVNNNYTDSTAEIDREYQEKFPVSLEMVIEKKQGLHHARFCGINHTRFDI